MKFTLVAAVAVAVLLASPVMGGSCNGNTAVGLGGVVTDGAGNYEDDALCTWTLPAPTNGTYLALQFTELHVEGFYDFPCLAESTASTWGILGHSCMRFDRNVSAAAVANSDALSAVGVSNYTLCTSHQGAGAEFAFDSDGTITRPGFTATVVNVSLAECDNPTDEDGFVAAVGSPFYVLGEEDEEDEDYYDYDGYSWDDGYLGWWPYATTIALSIVGLLICILVAIVLVVRSQEAKSSQQPQVVYVVAQPGFAAAPAGAAAPAVAPPPAYSYSPNDSKAPMQAEGLYPSSV